jgi:putative NADH-flavin reductase
MKIALIGASGNVGSRLVAEATRRGHNVTALARNPEKIATAPNVTSKKIDALDGTALAEALSGHDVAITATRFVSVLPMIVIAAVKKAQGPRLVVVGGASSLTAAPGVKVFDTPHFPVAYRAEASAGMAFLEALKASTDLDWTFLSPSSFFGPGPRTEKFRLGKDDLLVAPDGKSSISYDDYAIAMLDEIETPRHSRERFTVGY